MEDAKKTGRSLQDIGCEIIRVWKKPYFGAVPYMRAMTGLQDIDDYYGMDSAREIVLRFLTNASRWRGEDAKRIKAELRAML